MTVTRNNNNIVWWISRGGIGISHWLVLRFRDVSWIEYNLSPVLQVHIAFPILVIPAPPRATDRGSHGPFFGGRRLRHVLARSGPQDGAGLRQGGVFSVPLPARNTGDEKKTLDMR